MQLTTLNLEQLVKEVVTDCQRDAEGRDITWNIGQLPEVQADPSMLRLVLMNLIGNAVKYTRPRQTAHIEISSQENGDQEAIIFIRDPMAWDLPCSTLINFSASFNDSTRRMPSKVPESAWRTCAASSIATAARPGRMEQ